MAYTLDTTFDAVLNLPTMEVAMDKPVTAKENAAGHALATDLARHDDTQCTRCGGLVVIDHCFDVLGDTDEIDCQVFRCIQCGDLVDHVILRNRTNPPALSSKKHVKWSSRKLATTGDRCGHTDGDSG